MKRFLFLAPFALAFSASAANVKISDLALVSTPSTNTFQEIADLNASGTNKSARVFLAWTSVGGSLRPLLPATNYYFGADIFASGTNNGQNITLLGNRAAYQAIFDSATHDVFGAGFYPFRASVLQGASDVSAIGQNSLATSYLTNFADGHAWGNYALYGLHATNSSNIYGRGHSAGQGAIVTASGNLFFDGNETGLGSYFTNVTDMSLFNGALKNATISDSHNFGAFGIDALSGFTGSLTNVFYFGTNIDVYAHGLNIGPYWSTNGDGYTSLVSSNSPLLLGTVPLTTFFSGPGITFNSSSALNSDSNLTTELSEVHISGSTTFSSSWVHATLDDGFTGGDQNGFYMFSGLNALDETYPVINFGNGIYAASAEVASKDGNASPGGSAALIGINDGNHSSSYGLIGSSAVTKGTNYVGVGIVGSTTLYGGATTPIPVGIYGQVEGASPTVPIWEPSVALFDNKTTGVPIITARSSGSKVFQVVDDGSVQAGTTNRWKTGSDAPGASGLTLVTTNYVNITVNGVAYKLALVQ